MFHILIENSTPERLVGGPWDSVRVASSNVPPSVVECGLKGGQIREAISQPRYKSLINSGKLKKDRACKACLRKAGTKGYGKREDTEASSGTEQSQ